MWSYIITDFSCLWLHKKASILSPQRVVLCVWVPSTPRRERQSFKSKLAKQHNRKCEGQEDRASSLSLHRQQSAAALFNSRELIHLLLVMPRLSSLGPFRRTQRDWVQASFYLTSHDFLNFQPHPALSLSSTVSPAHHIETFADISVKLMQLYSCKPVVWHLHQHRN